AGLTAAMYLTRFRRSVLLFDAGRSRARWIPRSHNCPGFPAGVSGESLLQRMRQQADESGARPVETRITRLRRRSADVSHDCGFKTFELTDRQHRNWRARTVLLATGVEDKVPPDTDLSAAIDAAIVRFCAVCDGPEAEGRRIAVYGTAGAALEHAIYLRTWSREVTALFASSEPLEADVRARASAAGVELLRASAFPTVDRRGVEVALADGSRRRFDVLYPALGADVHSALAAQLQADVDDQGA